MFIQCVVCIGKQDSPAGQAQGVCINIPPSTAELLQLQDIVTTTRGTVGVKVKLHYIALQLAVFWPLSFMQLASLAENVGDLISSANRVRVSIGWAVRCMYA